MATAIALLIITPVDFSPSEEGEWPALYEPPEGRDAGERTERYVINIAGQFEQKGVDLLTEVCLHRFSFLTLQMSKGRKLLQV